MTSKEDIRFLYHLIRKYHTDELDWSNVETIMVILPDLLKTAQREMCRSRCTCDITEIRGFPEIDLGTCIGCDCAEWRDENTYDWNIAEGYWHCKKYHETLNSTWNDYGCNKCEDCISKNGYVETAEQEMEEAAWGNDQDIQKQ